MVVGALLLLLVTVNTLKSQMDMLPCEILVIADDEDVCESLREVTPIRPAFMTVFATVVALLAVPVLAFSQEEDEEAEYFQALNEVFQTALVYPQDAGEVQLTLWPSFADGADAKLSSLGLALEYGITDAFTVEIEWTGFSNLTPDLGASSSGIGDLELGGQLAFMQVAGPNTHAAVGLGVSLPVASPEKELSDGFVEFEPYILLARDFPERNHLQLFTQVSLGLVRRAKDPADPLDAEPAAHEFSWSGGFFVAFDPVRFTGELTVSTNTWNHDGEESSAFLTPGIVLNLPGSWEVGIGAPIGLSSDSDGFGLIGIVLYEFETR